MKTYRFKVLRPNEDDPEQTSPNTGICHGKAITRTQGCRVTTVTGYTGLKRIFHGLFDSDAARRKESKVLVRGNRAVL